jgi:hypothetical protein
MCFLAKRHQQRRRRGSRGCNLMRLVKSVRSVSNDLLMHECTRRIKHSSRVSLRTYGGSNERNSLNTNMRVSDFPSFSSARSSRKNGRKDTSNETSRTSISREDYICQREIRRTNSVRGRDVSIRNVHVGEQFFVDFSFDGNVLSRTSR